VPHTRHGARFAHRDGSKTAMNFSSIHHKRGQAPINWEVERGLVEHLNSDLTIIITCNNDRAQEARAKELTAKLKANNVPVEFIRDHIVIRGWSDEGKGYGRHGLKSSLH